MKLGLLTDIHEHVDYLRYALDQFRKLHVEKVIVIGDIFEMGGRIEETCRLLTEAKAVGVWGNHDFGLSGDLDDETRAKYPATVIDLMTSLRPRLVIDDCHFMHVEAWLDPEDIADLWYFEGPPDEHGNLERIFKAVPSRIMFAGHFHKWLMATPLAVSDWQGDVPLRLDQGRYFVVIGALCEGHFAIFDTVTSDLIPFNHE